jgi:hypothetical protein
LSKTVKRDTYRIGSQVTWVDLPDESLSYTPDEFLDGFDSGFHVLPTPLAALEHAITELGFRAGGVTLAEQLTNTATALADPAGVLVHAAPHNTTPDGDGFFERIPGGDSFVVRVVTGVVGDAVTGERRTVEVVTRDFTVPAIDLL